MMKMFGAWSWVRVSKLKRQAERWLAFELAGPLSEINEGSEKDNGRSRSAARRVTS